MGFETKEAVCMDWCHESVMCVDVQSGKTFWMKHLGSQQLEIFMLVLGFLSPYDESKGKNFRWVSASCTPCTEVRLLNSQLTVVGKNLVRETNNLDSNVRKSQHSDADTRKFDKPRAVLHRLFLIKVMEHIHEFVYVGNSALWQGRRQTETHYSNFGSGKIKTVFETVQAQLSNLKLRDNLNGGVEMAKRHCDASFQWS